MLLRNTPPETAKAPTKNKVIESLQPIKWTDDIELAIALDTGVQQLKQTLKSLKDQGVVEADEWGERWRLASKADWEKLDSTSETITTDYYSQSYKGWDIYLNIPNGGILSVAVVCGEIGYWIYTEFFEQYENLDWHIAIAKEKIDICSGSLTSVVESVEDSLSQESKRGDLNSKDSARKMSTVEISSVKDIQESKSSGMLIKSHQSQISISSQLHLPASPSQCRENGKGQRMEEIVSPESSAQSQLLNPSTSALKTSPESSTVQLPQEVTNPTLDFSSKQFPKSGTMRNGLLLEADTLAPPLIEKDYCWLPAPTALSHTKGRPPGLSKLENFLLRKGLLNKGEVLNPVILAQWFKIPMNWFDPLESRAATELLEEDVRQQEIFSVLASQRSPLEESSILRKLEQPQNKSLTKKRRGRPKGKKNKRAASGSLIPIVENRKGKIYPVVMGDRVPKSEAFNFPKHYNWLYQWSEYDGAKWRTKSKRVPCTRIYSIKYLISCDKPISEILERIK